MRRAVTLFVLGVLAVIGVLAGVYAPGGGATVGKANATIKINVKASSDVVVKGSKGAMN